MKTILHDGISQITKISVICMFKNNEGYLKNFFFSMVEKLESKYDILFEYFVIENNSQDNTRTLLKDFFKKKSTKSKLLLFNSTKEVFTGGDGKQHERINNISEIRNKLVNTITPLVSQWCLFVDSNIHFKEDILERMFSYEPSKNNIGMLTPYTQQLFMPEVHKNTFPNLEKPTLLGHYYDTFSFYDIERKNMWPLCGFAKCKLCSNKTLKNRNKVSDSDEIVDVTSCFGGFALIHTDIINNKVIRWDTLSHTMESDESICEHFLFCYLLNKMTNKRIVILQKIDDVFRTY